MLFFGVDSPTQCENPSSSVSSAFTPPPPQQSPVSPPTDVQRPFEVIDQLMQDAEGRKGLSSAFLQVFGHVRLGSNLTYFLKLLLSVLHYNPLE